MRGARKWNGNRNLTGWQSGMSVPFVTSQTRVFLSSPMPKKQSGRLTWRHRIVWMGVLYEEMWILVKIRPSSFFFSLCQLMFSLAGFSLLLVQFTQLHRLDLCLSYERRSMKNRLDEGTGHFSFYGTECKRTKSHATLPHNPQSNHYLQFPPPAPSSRGLWIRNTRWRFQPTAPAVYGIFPRLFPAVCSLTSLCQLLADAA